MTQDIAALLRSRHTLLWINTREEARAERVVLDACASAKYEMHTWDCAQGICDATGARVENIGEALQALQYIDSRSARRVYVLRDIHKFSGDPYVVRSLRNLAKSLQQVSDAKAIRMLVVIGPSSEIPPELADHVTLLDLALPTREEIGRILDAALESAPTEARVVNGAREAAIDAALGLSEQEAGNCFALSIVREKRINPTLVAGEKRRAIARSKVLTWIEPDVRGLDGIGGLDVLKAFALGRKQAFSAKARAYGLPSPKGVLLVGVPGCGKSLTPKCLATAWGMPLLRLDVGAVKSKFVGESETNLRLALATAEAISPCVLWLDEIEKALAGSQGPQGDGGVSADALGAILSWMQERGGQVFVVATANDVSALPPELLRKGRFDEVFFVDLPTVKERVEIIAASIRASKRDPETFDVAAIAGETPDFTGAELAAIVPDALFAAFADGAREPRTEDLITAARTVVPLAKTASEKISALREWAKGRARSASAKEAQAAKGRVLDV